MMEYNEFKNIVELTFKNYLPEPYCNMKCVIHKVDKVNRTVDAFNFFPDKNGMNVTPTMYINDMYEHYKVTGDLNEVFESAAAKLVEAVKDANKIASCIDYSKANEKIVFQLINTEQNKEMLKDVPHREFQDLSIIYKWVVNREKDGVASILIRNDLAERLGFSEMELYKIALENTKEIFPPTIKPMTEVIMEIFMKNGAPDGMFGMTFGDIPPNEQMYVISNDVGINGAISMLYTDGLDELAKQVESDLYIMPSSVHETIAVSTDMGEPEELAKMVSEINMDQVSLGDRLSNQVYHYDKDLQTITLATHTPNKRLDGIVAEQNKLYDTNKPSR